MNKLVGLLSASSFMPHGHCYLWRPDILWLNVGSDALIAVSYFVIPWFLVYFVKKRQDLAFNWVFVMFALFILACGTTHLVEILTVWYPAYGAQGLIKLFTAAVSLATAVALWPLMPKALALPSHQQLREINADLEAQITERSQAEQKLRFMHQNLERLIKERTEELAETNAALLREIEERKHAERDLLEQRERFRVTLSSIGDGVIATNTEGLIEFINPVAEVMTGWSTADAVGKDVGEVFHIENEVTKQRAQNPIVRVLREGVKVGLANHTVLISKDGRQLPIDDSGSPIRDAKGAVVGAVLVFHDIAERKQAQAAQARLAALVESSNDAIVGQDLAGKITSWNKSAERIFGYTAEEVTGKSIAMLIPQGSKDDLEAMLSAVKRGERIANHETERVRKDGRRISVSLSISAIRDQLGTVIGIAKIARDVTERVTAATKLRRWDYIFTNAGWAVAVASPDGILEDVNPAFARMHGYGVDDLIGLPVAATIAANDRGRLPELQEAANDLGSVHFELTHRRKDGSCFPALTTTSAFKDEDGRVLFRAATVQDISERKEAERRIEHAFAQAQRANRIKDEFLATLSHELRTPLNAILGHTELLQERLHSGSSTPAEQWESVDAIQRNARAQNQLIADLLDVSRIISGKMILEPTEANLAPVLTEVIDSMQVACRAKGVTIATELSDDGLVSGDPARLRQVAWNLIANAVKFTPAGGRIDVQLTATPAGVTFTVKDNGKGIEADFMPYIFDRFRQEDSSTTRRYGGLGLGLAIVRHIVELHGGTVQADSDGKDQGATFIVRLPPADAKPKVAKQPAPGRAIKPPFATPLPAKTSLSGLSILVVDDHADSRILLTRFLTYAGSTARSVSSAAEAMDSLAVERFDCLVCDIGMPDEDGYSLIGRVRAEEQKQQRGPLPAIAVTAFAREEDKHQALTAGFHRHLAKPVRPAELVQAVSALISDIGTKPAPS